MAHWLTRERLLWSTCPEAPGVVGLARKHSIARRMAPSVRLARRTMDEGAPSESKKPLARGKTLVIDDEPSQLAGQNGSRTGIVL